MCEQAGLTVKRLCRVSIGSIKLDGLPVGKWRYLSDKEVEELYRALTHGATNRRFYARDHVALLDRGTIIVTPIDEHDECCIEVERTAMRSYCGNAVLYYEHTEIDNVSDYNLPPEIALLDEQKLQYPLILRRWREGDSFIPFGMAGRKKVSDYLTDRKVSIIEKQRQFVLVSGDDIVWLVGHRTDERYRITSHTESILKITKEHL
jgi:tRNA(Ile)-lysidine synthase